MLDIPTSNGTMFRVEDNYVKLCKNCSFVLGQRNNLFSETARCGAPQNVGGIDLVTGLPLYKIELCDKLRYNGDAGFGCGAEGKWFQLYILPPEVSKLRDSVRPAKGLDLGM